MKKLFEITNENLVQCDNPKCGFVIKNPTLDPNAYIGKYVNMPCPKCGENLLTEKDYKDSLKFMAIINWLNKYFSWLTFFHSNKSKEVITTIHVHNGIKVVKDSDAPEF